MAGPEFLHVFSTFAPGGPQVRTIQIMNALPELARHSIVAMDGVTSAASLIQPQVDHRILPAPPKAGMLETAPRMRKLIAETRPALILTYNWGAIDTVLAAALSPGTRLIHAEDGFGSDEAVALKKRRVLIRRILLRTASVTVVPSITLERIARERYAVPPKRLVYIPNGIDLERFQPGHSDIRERLGFTQEQVLFGYVGHLRAEKNLPLLIEAFAAANLDQGRLILVGEGPVRSQLETLIASRGIEDRVVMVGAISDPAPWYRAFDVFTLSSATEQMPIALLEAMASGSAAICTDVGDCAAMLGTRKSPAIVPPGRVDTYAAAMRQFAMVPAIRRDRGLTNRKLCEQNHSFAEMVSRYRELYLNVKK